jgi:hypothetical protein
MNAEPRPEKEMKGLNIETFFGGIIAIAGYLIALMGVLILGFQIILWMRNGYWTPFSARQAVSVFAGGDPIPYPALSWRGIEKVVVWLLDAPLSVSLWVDGWIVIVVGLIVIHDHKDD